MNIITNNCVGGFVYKELLNEPYNNPFIWTRIPGESFLELVDNFDNIDFNDFVLGKVGEGLSNNFKITIQNKIDILYTHYHFDAKCKEIVFAGKRKNDIKYNKIWEYIYETYVKRSKRINKNDKKFIIWYDPKNFFPDSVYKLPNICKKHKYKCLIFSNLNIELNEYCKQYPVKTKWLNEDGGWHDSFFKEYKNTILEELKSC